MSGDHVSGGRNAALATTASKESGGGALAQVRVEAWKALGAAISGAPRAERDEAWRAVLAVVSVLGTERIEGWKAVAGGLGVSVTRARELALPSTAFRLPVRYGPRGVYMTRLALALWLAEYSAPHGAHAGLKRAQRPRRGPKVGEAREPATGAELAKPACERLAEDNQRSVACDDDQGDDDVRRL